MKKRILSIILAIAMLACMIPMGMVTVFAEETHTHTAGTEWMTDGRAHWLACADEDCPLNKAEDSVLEYEIAFSSYEGPELKELLDYSEKCGTYSEEKTSMLMGRQGRYDGTVSKTDGRTIIGLTEDQLKNIGNKLVIVGSDDSDNNKQVSVDIDCAYTWFYDVDAQTGEAVKIEAANTTDLNGNPIAAFVIIDNAEVGDTITGYGYYRVYSDIVSDSTLIGEALYKAPRTFKAVYAENGDKSLKFYFDTKDHSGEGKVYNNLPTDASESSAWGYNNLPDHNIYSVTIYPTVIKNKALTSTAYMFNEVQKAKSIEGAKYLDVSNVTNMKYMFYKFANNSNVTDFVDVPDASLWNTAKVTDMSYMFSYYAGSTGNKTFNNMPDVSNWNTESVQNMSNLFSSYALSSDAFNQVPAVDNWNVSNVTDMSSMFNAFGKNADNLNFVLNLSGWDVSKVSSADKAFSGVHGGTSSGLTFTVTIPNVNSNTTKNWYAANGSKITPPSGKSFTLAN